MHLHQLIYRRLARIAVGLKHSRGKRRRNNLIVLYICTGAALFTLPALLVWKSTPALVALGLAYWVAYLWLYFRLALARADVANYRAEGSGLQLAVSRQLTVGSRQSVK